MAMQYNKSGMSLREGKVFIDGMECMDAVKCEIKFTPDVWTGKQLGEKANSSRWLGYSIAGSITRRRSTPWLADIIKRYKDSGTTPEFTVQGIMDDPASDYFADHGSNVVTVVGCVPTGDFLLTALDSSGEIVDDVISFNGKDIV